MLKGILRCACCDCSMTPTHTTKNGSKRYRYYVCMKAQKRGWKNCKSKSVPAAEIEKFVVDKIRHVGHDAALVGRGGGTSQDPVWSRELGALVAERDELVKELEYWNEAIRAAAPKTSQARRRNFSGTIGRLAREPSFAPNIGMRSSRREADGDAGPDANPRRWSTH
ncbi:MAG: zinc ribbon domain-containing protein [Pirellulaceae bacterium]